MSLFSYSYQVSEALNLPDDVNYILDELGDARNDAKNNEVECHEMYDACPSKTISSIMYKFNKLMQ